MQAILALVHDLGPNWDLVSDVLSSNSQIKVYNFSPVLVAWPIMWVPASFERCCIWMSNEAVVIQQIMA